MPAPRPPRGAVATVSSGRLSKRRSGHRGKPGRTRRDRPPTRRQHRDRGRQPEGGATVPERRRAPPRRAAAAFSAAVVLGESAAAGCTPTAPSDEGKSGKTATAMRRARSRAPARWSPRAARARRGARPLLGRAARARARPRRAPRAGLVEQVRAQERWRSVVRSDCCSFTTDLLAAKPRRPVRHLRSLRWPPRGRGSRRRTTARGARSAPSDPR